MRAWYMTSFDSQMKKDSRQGMGAGEIYVFAQRKRIQKPPGAFS